MKLIHSNKMSILYDIESVLAEVDLNVATVKQMKQGRERSSYRAVINWLTKYKFNSSATNLEKVKGLLEAFFHFCEVEDWTRAKKIIIFPLPLNNSTKTRIYLQLGSWGYYSEQTKLCKKMLNQIDAATDIIFFNALSITFMYLGEYDKIIDYSKKYLSIAEQINDEMSKGTAFCNIGLAYYLQGKYEEAIEKQNEYLVISKKIGEARHLANALGNLGLCYDGLKQYQKAIKSYHEQLDIARNNNLPQSEGNALGNIGLAYHHLGDYKTAIPYHQEYLTISEKLNEPWGKSNALANLGDTQIKLQQYEQALENLEESQKIAKEIKAVPLEAAILKMLAELYYQIDNYQEAKKYCEQALEMSDNLSLPLVEECENLKEQIEQNYDVTRN